MEKTKKIYENGHVTQTNWILDDVIETLEKYSIENDELIKELYIEKIEYARLCMVQALNHSWEELDSKLKEKIVEIGGVPTKIIIMKKTEK
jgi:hypothetical protein